MAGPKYHAGELSAWTKQRHEAALEPDLPILDPHHHLWDDTQRGRYLIDELAEDVATGHNIMATIFVENGRMYRAAGPVALRPVGEVEFVNGVAAMSASGGYGKARLCAGIVGHADLTLGHDVENVLAALIAAGNGRLCGIRHGVATDPSIVRRAERIIKPRIMYDAAFRAGFARLASFGLSFDAWLFYPQLPDLMDLLRTFPNVNVILNHCGGLLGVAPRHHKHDEVFGVWRNHIRELAQFRNLSVKVGGLGMPFCGWDFHLRDVPPASQEVADAWRPYIETCIEAFGVERCMMESNFPVDKQSCGYGVLWNAFKRITQTYSAREKAALYHDTAVRVYRLAV